MMHRSKIWILLLITCSYSPKVFAQQFKYAAPLDSVTREGFYRITISPQLSAFIKTDISDLRIAGKKGEWVPHLLQPQSQAVLPAKFTTFPIVQNTFTDSGKNFLVIENTIAAGIDNLKLFLKNAAVSRTAVLSGSDNRRQWFIIDDKISIGRSYGSIKDEYLQEINFPMVKYHYLKLIIDNLHNEPLLITKAGIYNWTEAKATVNYQDNPLPVFTQKDSINNSYIEVRQTDNYQFDKISLWVTGAKFYSREVEIFLPDNQQANYRKHGTILGSFNLLSALPAVFELPRIKAALFFIIIKNADNPPLNIKKVTTQQQVLSMVTYLQPHEKYELVFDDPGARLANYDLQAFKDSIMNTYPLSYGTIHALKKTTALTTGIKKNRWLWASIIIAGAVLCFLTLRLTKDISRFKN